ncbi:hypothetical protein JTE90_002406 [Oedothorax gibbosus]|uniref:ABC-type xenobiotic transporter n=1 Tax=Oedothorax gibbosus TaxID=931172 RepID=A0AAV6UHR4_9ARAC|nr:hypothetical protein JTE90_002406 [Oedothorax gibbosus]
MSTKVEASSPAHDIHRKSDFKKACVNKGYEDTEGITGANYAPEKGKDQEKEEEEKKNELPPVGFFSLFRYSSSCDKTLVIIGTIVAIVSGASMPAVMIIFGKVINNLIAYDAYNKNMTNETFTTEKFLSQTAELCAINAGFGFAFVFCNYIMVSFFSLAAANQAFKIKGMFMASILKQDIGWYDTTETGDFASRITGDLTRIQDGIGEKVCICLSFISSTVLCVGTGFFYSWKLSLVILSITPVMTIAMALMSKIQASVSREEMQAYGTAGAVAEEVLSSIRTVVSFGGEKKEIQRYDNCLVPARKKGIKRGLMTALSACITWVCIFMGYALAFWYGVKLIIEGNLNGGDLIIVFFNVMSASMFIGQTAPYFEAFAIARGSAAKIYNIIDRVPSIDSSSKEGKKPDLVKGTIHIRDVHFNYPARPTVPVLQGVSLDVQQGETVALVGPSGCGKSTIIQLILRFYDTDQGAVLLDENNVRDLNVGWLRDQIGLVGQEPVLFSTTIAENIRYGKRDATHEEIENAAKTANVHDFIQALPLKYDTLVGERGTQLSGGQKQRIAIARALVKNPKILLLDEATSALDTESESVVQAALDEASQGRTTVVVAHRLSTIRTADKIVVLSEGVVKEVGTHDELMKKEGIYFNLVQTQTKSPEEEKEDEDELDELDEKEEYMISELGRKMSVLSGNSVGSAEGLPGAVRRQISTASTGYRRQSSAKSGYDRQQSVMSSALGRQMSIISGDKDFLADDADDELAKKASPSQLRLWKVSASEWPYALVGGIAAALFGLHFPAFGIIFGDILGVLSGDPTKIREETDVFCLAFVLMAVTSGVCSFLQVFMFTVAGEKLTSRLRKLVFSNIIAQDIEFFDHPKNSVGSLCSRLTSDASSVQGAAGSRISTLLQATSTLIASIVLALWYEYRIGLVALAFIPCVLLGAYFEQVVVGGQATSDKLGTEDASKVAIEAIEAIRTVASLHQEETFYLKFRNHLLGPHKKSRTQSHVRGIIYGFAQGITAFAYAATMFYGSRLVAWKMLEFSALLKVLEGVMLGAMMIGQAVAFAPDYQKAKVAAVRIFQLLDLKPKIDAFSIAGTRLEDVKGHIRFNKVRFNYPSRPNVKILRGLDLEIEPGKTVALVGSSGCGKSTCVQLIERFYEPESGSVLVDNTDVSKMNVSNLRSHVGLVSQEPVLFSYSIAENIAYGDNSRQVDMNEIVEAARKANIHNFISTLPQGYETPVGDKGTQLSGGQKQRVAIARALLRNPKILLLDEATSALDAESEKIVQDALDKARSGRTCLVIAHRLTTIQNADVIMVIHKGRIVEQGTHQELLNKKGHYYNLHNTQSSVE